MRKSIAVFLLATLALALPTLSSAASYTVTDLGTLGGTTSEGYGINASGQVTGYSYITGNSAVHAFLYDGTMHDLGTLGGTTSYGVGVNTAGKVAGRANTTGNAVSHAFLYDGTMHDLGTLGGTYSQATGINNSGQMTGNAYTTGDAAFHAFLYDGTMHDLGTLGGTYSTGNGINATGQVTGYAWTTSGEQHAFLYDGTMHDLGAGTGYGINDQGQVTGQDAAGHAFLYDGTVNDLGTLGGTTSFGSGINASGNVTGYSRLAGGGQHAFLYDIVHGMVDLNSLINPSSGWTLISGDAINDAGQITGQGMINRQQHAFLLTPTPEPSSIVLAALGFVGLVGWGWRRRKGLGTS